MTAQSPTVELRPLSQDDLVEVHRLEVASSSDPWSRELLADELRGDRSDRTWLVAVTGPAGPGNDRAGPTVVGFGGMLRLLDEAHVMNLAVAAEHRRRGVASRLLGTLLLDAVGRGAASATLEVRPSNAGAIGLYGRFGFEVAGRRPGYYADGEDALIMWCHRLDRRVVAWPS